MTRGQNFIQNAKCSHGHRPAMSNSAWCDLNRKNILRLHDYCPNSNCKCQKQITSTPKQFQLESGSIKSKLQETSRETQSASNKFFKPALNMASPCIGMVVSAKTRNSKIGQGTTKILRSISARKVHSLTEMHGNGLRLRVM